MTRQRLFSLLILLTTALAVGFLYSLDQWILLKDSIFFLGQRLVISTDTHIHVLWPQVREVIDGHLWVADTQLFEHRFGPPLTPWPWFPIFLYTIFWKIFGVNQFLPWSTLIIAAASFLLLSQLITEMTGRRTLGILSALLLFASRLTPLFFFPTSSDELKLLVNLFIPGSFNDIMTTRVDFLPYESFNPGFLVLGTFLLLAHRSLKRENMKLFAWIGACAGLLIYTYPFFWIFGVMFFAGWGLVELFRRRWMWFWRVVLAVIIDFAVGLPFWWNQLQLKKQGILAEMNLRNAGFEIGHYFRISQWRWYMVWLVLSLILFTLARKRKDTRSIIFLAIFFLGVFFSLNMQVVTGINIHSDHWINKLSFLPLGLALCMFFVYLTDWLAERKILRRTFSTALLGVLVLGTLIGGVTYGIETAASQEINFPFNRDQWEAYTWIDEHIPTDNVILTLSDTASTYLTIYTSARSFLPHALNTHAFDQEIFDRWYVADAVYGVPVDYLIKQFAADPSARGPLAQFFWVKFRPSTFDASLAGYQGGDIPATVREQVISGYRSYKLNLEAMLQQYRLDYILETPYEEAIEKINLAKMPYLEKVFEHGKVKLYKLRPELIR